MSRRRLVWIGTPVALLVGLGLATAWAAPGGDDTATPNAAAIKAAAAGRNAGGGEKKSTRFKDFNEVVKDMQATPGLFTLYRYKASDKSKDPETLLAKIPAKLLNEDLLFASSIYSGGRLTGYMWSDYLVRWEVVGKHLKMVTPDTRYIQKPNEPIADVIERTYTPSFLAAVPIEAMTSGGDVLIDLGKLLKSDIAGVSFMGGSIRSDLSTWNQIKNFPDNILIETELALYNRGGGSTVGVAYAFRRLPKQGSYTPRAADPRVGYFITARMDWAKAPHERDMFERYVQRWHLEKREPSLELSPPKEPIVFIIEDTVPIKWRRWVREGIEEWNRAFEAIGYDQAIVVRQQTKDNEYADYDPEDARYNFFRWIVSGRAFAMGPSRVDPRTGQILDADIIFDDSMVRGWMEEFDFFAPETTAAYQGPAFREWMHEQQEILPDFLRAELERRPMTQDDEMMAMVNRHMCDHGRHDCDFAVGLQQQISLAQTAMMATGLGDKKIPERLVGEVLRHIVTHEVGHTLGLRHNFKGSAWLTLEEIKRRRAETDEPTTASVMDYTPIMFFADDDLEKVRHFTSPVLGPYDMWAVEYGYSDAKGDEELAKITDRCTEPALQYNTDEDTSWVYSPDPLSNRWDHTATPLEWARSRVELADKYLSNIEEWALQDDDPYQHLTRAWIVLSWERSNYFQYVARLIGGQYFSRHHKGDPDAKPPFVLVDPELQREALKLLTETVFNPEFFEVEPDLLNKLAPSRWSHWGVSNDRRLDFPIHYRVRWMQLFALLNITAPPVLERVYDAELKTDADNKFTTAELICSVRDAIWEPVNAGAKGSYTDAKPFLSSVTRTLQRQHLNILLNMCDSRPGSVLTPDVQAMVRLAVRDLAESIEKVLDGDNLDFASRAHLTECKSRIDRMMEAPFRGY